MLSIIIATMNSERALVPTLAALVPGAMDGLVSEVIIADGGSRDGTATVADVAGCNFLSADANAPATALGIRLTAATMTARAPWLLFLRPGTILDAPWTVETRRFAELTDRGDRAAVFRRGAVAEQPLRDVLTSIASALGARPRPEQGLVISKRFYRALDGHSAIAADPEADLIRRIGRRRLARLAARAFSAGQ